MSLTVKDLMIELGRLNPEARILVASDEEGNHVRSLYAVGAPGLYYREFGEYYMNEDDYVGDPPAHLVQAVVLWP